MIKAEKNFFKRYLLSPGNWHGTAQAFLAYLIRALKYRTGTAFKPFGFSTRVRPSWLPPDAIFFEKVHAATLSTERTFSAEWPDLGVNAALPEVHRGTPGDSDIEKEFHFHRWGWLVWKYLHSEISRDKAIAWMLHWIRENSDRKEQIWEPYSCCERIANLSVIVDPDFAHDALRMKSEKLSGFLFESAVWILKHLEYYGPQYTNNHILNNGRALAIAGALTGERSFLKAGLSILKNMLPTLVSEQGFLRERSSHYQLVILRWILDSEKALSRHEKTLPPDELKMIRYYSERIRKASAQMCDEDGGLKILIGDVSPDATPEETCGILQKLHPQWQNISLVDKSDRANDGWFFIQSEGLEIISQQPKTYPVEYPHHGHADITSFCLRCGGRGVLIDPGRISYVDEELSQCFRSGWFHNVPLVDGLSPVSAPFFSNWMPGRYGSAVVHASLDEPRTLRIEHDGFRRLGKLIHHIRRISIRDSVAEVMDEFAGEGSHEIILCWHFAPDFNATSVYPGRVRMSSSFCSVNVLTDSPGGTCDFETEFHRTTLMGGWYSPFYGHAEPSLTMHVKTFRPFPTSISTQFRMEPCAA